MTNRLHILAVEMGYIITLMICMLTGAINSFGQDSVFTNSIGIEFVLIDTGSMRMSKFLPPYPLPPGLSDGNEQGMTMNMGGERSYRPENYELARELSLRDASAGFNVTISKPYYIGKYEVTQAQWKKVMGSNPSSFTAALVENPDDHPVETVTWEDVQLFLKRLNAMDAGHRYRLPSEFEWEFAARAGAEGDIPWSEIRDQAQLGLRATAEVGRKKPNAWGLYDVLGNVWEWVEDYYNEKLFADAGPPRKGKHHVLKGASFTGDVKNATYMTHAAGPGNGWDVGFRIVMEADNE